MSVSHVNNVGIRGIATAVPSHKVSWREAEAIFGEDAARIAEYIGVKKRCVVKNENICASDLCWEAADRLIKELNWERDSVDILVMVTQSPDYVLPATSCILQQRLALSRACAAFDVNLGCSGYVYGLWLASHLLSSGAGGRALVLAGDTSSRGVSPLDRATAMLFGDAGTATGLERVSVASPITFKIGTDGSGAQYLMIPAGGFRKPHSPETSIRRKYDKRNFRSEEDLFMDGAEVFSFMQRTVPPLVCELLEISGLSKDDVDAFVMHQSNQFALNYLSKRLKLSEGKNVIAMEQFGNTSSASIPLAITHALRKRLCEDSMRLMLVGFGVGWSWGACLLECGPIVIPEIIEVNSIAKQENTA
ncbi:3-oxoacyl-ACP synthase III family protein [Pajaroellobacter abortibovis]|uniref:3-oxoacyl-ACP synthase n=1 Tax=Pajaroellobacter abortibovis TaxID=1882918 RepID=A0A1L6MYZ7_9BACT|nr:ketoacyl-ACP synthase III [Pajaroellobacter abortibovis]APS00605.1 hypothetical protein BCY86_07915 [Pajaroellobacter abortibovis]